MFGMKLYKFIESKAASYFLFGLRWIGGDRSKEKSVVSAVCVIVYELIYN